MTLINLRYTGEFEKYIPDNEISAFIIGRVTQEHREIYIASTRDDEYNAEITGI